MEEEIDILARTIYAEARGEYKTVGISGLIAIVNIVMNRLKHPKIFGNSVRDICLKPYQFSCWLKDDPNYSVLQNVTQDDALFKICVTVAKEGIDQKYPDLTHTSDHYHYFTASIPYWAKHHTPKVIIGRHLFYQLQPPRVIHEN